MDKKEKELKKELEKEKVYLVQQYLYNLNFVSEKFKDKPYNVIYSKCLNRYGYDIYIEYDKKLFMCYIKICGKIVFKSRKFGPESMLIEIKDMLKFAENFIEYYSTDNL